MRRLAVILGVLALALPAAAGALLGGSGDGTLVVDNANSVVQLRVRGGIIGHFDQGTIEVVDPIEGDGPGPVVKQCHDIAPGPKRIRCTSSDVRFRLIGGLFRVRIEAVGIDLSVVGRGAAVLDASTFGDPQTGRYALNGGPYQPIPRVSTVFTLGAPLTATLGSK